MRFLGPDRAGNVSTPFMVAILTVVLAMGCAGTDAALAGECNQTDSTVTCLLPQAEPRPVREVRCDATSAAAAVPC